MIEMLVCGLIMWYHVDCIQFYFYESSNFLPPATGLPQGYVSLAFSEKINKHLGIIHFWKPIDNKFRDICGNTVMSHELQRFKQNNWNPNFCNIKGNRHN